MTVLSVLATIFGTAMALANFPQAYKIFKRKSAKDISFIAFLILLLGAVVWVLYGIEIKSPPLIFANSVGIVSVALILLGWMLYGRKN